MPGNRPGDLPGDRSQDLRGRPALAEFSNLNLFVQLDGKEVWSANPPRFDAHSPHTAAYPKDVDLVPPWARAKAKQ